MKLVILMLIFSWITTIVLFTLWLNDIENGWYAFGILLNFNITIFFYLRWIYLIDQEDYEQ